MNFVEQCFDSILNFATSYALALVKGTESPIWRVAGESGCVRGERLHGFPLGIWFSFRGLSFIWVMVFLSVHISKM